MRGSKAVDQITNNGYLSPFFPGIDYNRPLRREPVPCFAESDDSGRWCGNPKLRGG